MAALLDQASRAASVHPHHQAASLRELSQFISSGTAATSNHKPVDVLNSGAFAAVGAKAVCIVLRAEATSTVGKLGLQTDLAANQSAVQPVLAEESVSAMHCRPCTLTLQKTLTSRQMA